jgi:hypothetical protein
MNQRCNRVELLVVVAVLAWTGALATQMSLEDIDDPFSDGVCPGQRILSYGSYIYNWPSKYDGVFWPATEERWVWLCQKSGYVSLGSDFADLSESERERIEQFLADNYDANRPPDKILDRLSWAEEIYRLRDKDDVFWAYFYRLMAHWSDREFDPTGAKIYRRKALPILERLAESTPPGVDQIQFLFLAGEYYRRFGNEEKARIYFVRVKETAWIDEEGNQQVGHHYFNELVADREKLLSEDSGRLPN